MTPLVLILLHGAASAAAPGLVALGARAEVRDGERAVAIAPRLAIDLRAAANGSGHERALPFSPWRRDDEGALHAVLDDPDAGAHAELDLRVPAGAAAAELVARVRFDRAGWARRVALSFDLPPGATVRDRAGRPLRVDHSLYLDRWDPKQIASGGALLLVDDGIDELTLSPAHGGGARVELALLSVAARPFRHDSRCAHSWHSPNGKALFAARAVAAGEQLEASLAIAPAGGSGLALARFPDGRRAALVVTDHADQSAPRSLAALARGRSPDLAAPTEAAAPPDGGLIGHHVTITKSLFWRGTRERPQLEDPRVVALADALAAAGCEIVPHSPSPKKDDRDTTRAAIDGFARFHARTWIDHQPETNCEAFSNQGWRGSGRFGIADLLAHAGYQYVWSAEDSGTAALDLLGQSLTHRAPTLYPLGRLEPDGPAGFWLFRSTWLFIERKRFLGALAPDRLDRLERDGGLAILHTYLETDHAKRTRFGLRNQMHEHEGALELDPGFEVLLAELDRRQQAGALWVPTLAELGDRLRARERVRVRYLADGRAVVRGEAAVSGLTVAGPRAAEVKLDGAALKGRRDEGGETRFWFDLPAGADVTVELTDGEKRVPLL